MAGLIALVGGDEFRHGCEEMDSAILEATHAQKPKVVVIPTAAALENPARAASNGVTHFSNLGAEASSLMVLNSSHSDDEPLLSPLDSADVIYFTGGNPAHLLETIKDSLLLEKMNEALDRGAIVGGSSAGAMVMGSWMRFREWREALGIVDGIVTLPHHERSDPDSVAKELSRAAPSAITALGIDGKTGCLGGPKEWKVLGAGNVTVYRNGEWQRFSSGGVFTLD